MGHLCRLWGKPHSCLMSFKNSLARRLYKRLSHLYTYADGLDPENTYTLLLSTILRDFGLRERTRLRDNIRLIKKALDELKEKGVFLYTKLVYRKGAFSFTFSIYNQYLSFLLLVIDL